MESPSSPPASSITGQGSSRSRSSTNLRLSDADLTCLTSFNPFAEEDEHDQSSYTLVSSLFSKMKNTFAVPLASAAAVATNTTSPNAPTSTTTNADARRPSYSTAQSGGSNFSTKTNSDRPNTLFAMPASAAPPLVSLTPAQSVHPTYIPEYERQNYPESVSSPQIGGNEQSETAGFGTAIPGFPIQDDTRSTRTSTSYHRPSKSVSKVMRRLRGEGLSRDYWMDDENCKECYDCKSVFTTWRRKHHCRICGQIFCSRCASNIIKGDRFGADGMVRVCNLCLNKLATVEEDDDDDHRSIISSATTFPAHQLGVDMFSLAHSPFSASQLFGRSADTYNLYSIAETRRQFYGSEGDLSRPITPLQMQEGPNGVWETVRDNPAPFRRALSDDDRDSGTPTSGSFHPGSSPKAGELTSKFIFPASQPITIDTTPSSIQFPISSPEHLATPTRTLSKSRGPNTPYSDIEVATPFIRSRVQSRLDSFEAEPAWRMRRESTAYAQELNLASMLHLKIMLRQMLTLERIPNIREWEETLLRLALRIAREMTFTALPHRQGQDMDVRRYVKIKKIPGGSPKDSEYVTGALITKNVAHKRMSRLQANPRVMLVTFPLEFSRVEGQYLHFSQIVRQEKEYLGNLASRIAALRPHVVLVEKSVSRLVLDALADHNIAVARGVKPSAIQTVARMTQGDVFSSIDKLALEPRLGHCARFCIQTFDHPLIPGRRKTYMRFEGCNRDMGCTLVLRGGDIETLRRIKKVTRFLTFVVRNLKLETHLWKDSVISLPSFSALAIPSIVSQQLKLNFAAGSINVTASSFSTARLLSPLPDTAEDPEITPRRHEEGHDDLPDEDAEQFRLTKRIDESLEPYTKTFISVSSTLRFLPPYPIRRMKELDNLLLEAKRAWEDEIILREERVQSMHTQEETITPSTASEFSQPTPHSSETRQSLERDDIVAQIDALMVSSVPVTPRADGLPPTSASDDGASYFSLTHRSKPAPPLNLAPIQSLDVVPTTDPEVLKTTQDIQRQSSFTLLKWQHDEFRRVWEWYLRRNHDDFVVEKYQCIHLREHTVPGPDLSDLRACFAPVMRHVTFYGDNDMTLGQFVEKTVNDSLIQLLDPKAICSGKACEQPLFQHVKVFTHNEMKLFVAVEKWDGQIVGRIQPLFHPDLLTTWSACQVCGSTTPFIPVSEEMQRYSFGKFLELHFYPADVKLVQGAGCQHNIYQHHIRYFAYRGMTVRFQAEAIQLHEVVYPPFRIRVRPETQLDLKNADFERLHYRNTLWYTGLVDDLKLISIEAATGDEEADARLLSDINVLINRAEGERDEISRLINKIYRDSAPTDTLALNQVHASRQDKIVAWQQDFDRLPKPRPPQSVSNRSNKRTSAFGSVRQIWPRRYDLSGAFETPHLPSASVSEAEEGPVKSQRLTLGDSMISSASETSEPETSTKAIDSKSDRETIPSEDKPELSSNPSISEESSTSLVQTTAPETVTSDEQSKTDPDSDSTIGAPRETSEKEAGAPTTADNINPSINDENGTRTSRLPRLAAHNMSVADLVKKYQHYLPAQGISDLAQTALSPRPVLSESEQEYPSTNTIRPGVARVKSRHRIPPRKTSTSDFEQGYAANVAAAPPPARKPNSSRLNSRIPGPMAAPMDSRQSSRRASPEKRTTRLASRTNRPPSPPNDKVPPSAYRQPKPRVTSRTKDKSAPKVPPTPGSKSTFRRPPSMSSNKVSTMARHYERLGRETERSRSRYAVIRSKPARPVAYARAKVEVLDSVKVAIADDLESSDSSEADDEGEEEGNDEDHPVPPIIQRQPPSSEASPAPVVLLDPPSSAETAISSKSSASDLPKPLTPELPEDEKSKLNPMPLLPPSPFLGPTRLKHELPLTPPTSEIDVAPGPSLLKALSGFWQQPTRNSIEADDLMNESEHIFRDSSMVVRLDEPTSIIALALNSPQYREMLAKSRADKRGAREAKLTESGETFMPDDYSVAESNSTWGVVNVETADSQDPTEDLRAPSSKLPWAITVESGGLLISCTVLYPEQFDALRRTYDCEKSMIESLSRCVKWNTGGGKSGSAFLKTRDDRFIAKELSKPELQAMETFAPAYFDYMSSSVNANRPTLLAKVFGCYKLTFRKTSNDKTSARSKPTQMNLLVMENLFYDRTFSRIYDLKGSTRNRHVQSTGRENEVLLDENLVEASQLHPYNIREHSKRIMRGALFSDSKFLADINVMDYSLVCGVDSSNNELVVGIVDYIRTYTWDKKLESWVKDLGGAGRGEPTIVTPPSYRQRFLHAMERYFPLIPDRWVKQADVTENESDILPDLWPDW